MQIATTTDRTVPSRARVQEDEVPTVLLLPGVNNSGPQHWQSRWELLPNFKRVEFGSWSNPSLRDWLPILDRAVRESPRPVVLVAHSLGCLAVTWWAALYWSEAFQAKIVGALLVAPPDVDRFDAWEAIKEFGPIPTVRLPFPGTVVASEDDPFASFTRSREMARLWGCNIVNAGAIGHINAEARIGEWTQGLQLLADLTGRSSNRLIAELGLRAALA